MQRVRRNAASSLWRHGPSLADWRISESCIALTKNSSVSFHSDTDRAGGGWYCAWQWHIPPHKFNSCNNPSRSETSALITNVSDRPFRWEREEKRGGGDGGGGRGERRRDGRNGMAGGRSNGRVWVGSRGCGVVSKAFYPKSRVCQCS